MCPLFTAGDPLRTAGTPLCSARPLPGPLFFPAAFMSQGHKSLRPLLSPRTKAATSSRTCPASQRAEKRRCFGTAWRPQVNRAGLRAPRAGPARPAQSLGLEPPPFTPLNNPPAPSPGRLRAEKRPLARVLPLTAPGPAARVPAPRRGAGGTRHTSLRGCELADTGHAPSCDQCPYETAQ